MAEFELLYLQIAKDNQYYFKYSMTVFDLVYVAIKVYDIW